MKSLVNQWGLPFNKKSKETISLARKSTFSINGSLQATITIGENNYTTSILVTDRLVAPVILDNDVQRQHSAVVYKRVFGGTPAEFKHPYTAQKPHKMPYFGEF